ncbi:MAG: endo-1,4-beta-xylanase [Phycisphaerales bacterium]|nr:MAG: endo-1,4-beta-xylanase [Phycisphaerales bacterium]
MDRRGFLKTSGCGAVWLASSRLLPAAESQKVQILAQADERIEKHRKGDAALKLIGPDGRTLARGIPVKITQERHKFLFGCNIFKLNRCKTPEDNTAYAEQFAALLNFATLPFYWWNYERRLGEPDDARTEEIIRWCKARNVTTKGHPLAWNYVDPRWLPKDPETAMQLQFKRIGRCVRKFKGDIDIWDVVNEATHYDREEIQKRAPVLTEAIRKMGVGPYVREAFKVARQANPNATLLINDYRTDAAYADKVISELVGESGRPLYDVVGIQSHMHGGYWGSLRAWQACERFAKFDKPLHFTETTVVSGPKSDRGWATTAEGERSQAKHVAEFYRLLFSHPAVEAITWWDFTDQNAWQRAPAGLVREDMTPKPAYDKLKELIRNRWWTQTEAAIQAEGEARFRGFLGDYEVAAQVDGRKLTGTFRLDRTAMEKIDVHMEV